MRVGPVFGRIHSPGPFDSRGQAGGGKAEEKLDFFIIFGGFQCHQCFWRGGGQTGSKERGDHFYIVLSFVVRRSLLLLSDCS